MAQDITGYGPLSPNKAALPSGYYPVYICWTANAVMDRLPEALLKQLADRRRR